MDTIMDDLSGDVQAPQAFVTVPAATEEMEMVVWLRGDEPYAGDFNIDAEKAMEILGIKRSRLTQISGRELRVGRIRVDRYIRPMYRKVDIEAYQGWSRATATHMKASSLIENAASKLEEHSQQLSGVFKDSLQEVSLEIEKNLDELKNFYHQKDLTLKTLFEETSKQTLLGVTEHLQAMALTFEDRLAYIQREISALQIHLPLLHDVKSLAEANQAELAKGHETIGASLKTLDERSVELAKEQATLSNFNRDVGKALSLIIQFQRDMAKKQEVLGERLDQLQTTMTQLATEKTEAKAVWVYRPRRRLKR